MNKDLLLAIVKHVFAGFFIIPADFIDFHKTKSLMSKDFLLSENIISRLEDQELSHKVWGCHISVSTKDMIVLLADCTVDKEYPEYAMFVQLTGGPAYGLYLVNNEEDPSAFMALSIDNKSWLECRTHLQASFLVGMENIKHEYLTQEKCANYKAQFDSFLSFIKFYEENYEG